MVEAEDDVVDCNEASDNGQKDEDGVLKPFWANFKEPNAPEDVDKK